MKSKTLKQNKVNIITLGCSKNLVDSEMLSGQLVANDIDVVHENKKFELQSKENSIGVYTRCYRLYGWLSQ